MRCEVCSSASAPKVMVPSAYSETIVPLFPRVRSSMLSTLILCRTSLRTVCHRIVETCAGSVSCGAIAAAVRTLEPCPTRRSASCSSPTPTSRTRAKALPAPAARARSTRPTSSCTRATGWMWRRSTSWRRARGAWSPSTATTTDGELRERLPEVATAELGGLRFAVVHETGPATGREQRCDAGLPRHRCAGVRSQPHPVGHDGAERPAAAQPRLPDRPPAPAGRAPT